jgi:hypothetical protein
MMNERCNEIAALLLDLPAMFDVHQFIGICICPVRITRSPLAGKSDGFYCPDSSPRVQVAASDEDMTVRVESWIFLSKATA